VWIIEREFGAEALSACQSLQNDYFAALQAARSCDVNGTGQCQKTAPTLNIGCGDTVCPVAVNSDSALAPLQAQWVRFGCAKISGFGCVAGCRSAETGICGAEDGGFACDPNRKSVI